MHEGNSGMENWIGRHRGKKTLAASVALFATVGLSACGGNGDGKNLAGKPGAVANAASDGGQSAAIKVEGQGTPLSGDIETIKAMTPPVTWEPDGAFPRGTVRLSARSVHASALKAHAPGAYTTLPWGDEALSLSTGTVTDLAGDGRFAIGRWTAGSDSTGSAFNVQQGRVWAVGAPVDVELPVSGMQCVLAAATRPTASDGNTAPGSLKSAAAVVARTVNALGIAENNVELSLQYSIGKDLDQTFGAAVPVGGMSTARNTRSSLYTTFLGPDASKPYLVVSYGVHSPTVGLINGLAVLNCS